MQCSNQSAWIGITSLLFLTPMTAYGQAKATETTVHKKTTTVRETVTTTHETLETHSDQSPRLVGIFVKNRAGRAFDEKLGAFEDLVTAEITDMGFQVMSPEDTVKAVRSYLGTELDEDIPGAKLDELLDNNTSALRLAQNMGVDYLLVVSITTFGHSKERINRPDLDIDRTVTTHKLRTVYKILDAGRGESISAGPVVSSTRTQQAENLEESSDVINDLLADASAQIADRLRAKGGAAGVADSKKADSIVEYSVICSVQDLSVPEVIKDEAGNYMLTANRYKLEALNVTVELDGVVIGTAPGQFQALPGLHKIRLTRVGYEDWEKTIKIRDGFVLSVALTLTPQGRRNWLEMASFAEGLKQSERMSEANAERVRGLAQMMRQSGYRIDRYSDHRSDVKIDTTDAPGMTQQNVAKIVWP